MSYPEHEPYHERRLDQQMLDALLRIEELLIKQANPAVLVSAAGLVSQQRAGTMEEGDVSGLTKPKAVKFEMCKGCRSGCDADSGCMAERGNYEDRHTPEATKQRGKRR